MFADYLANDVKRQWQSKQCLFASVFACLWITLPVIPRSILIVQKNNLPVCVCPCMPELCEAIYLLSDLWLTVILTMTENKVYNIPWCPGCIEIRITVLIWWWQTTVSINIEWNVLSVHQGFHCSRSWLHDGWQYWCQQQQFSADGSLHLLSRTGVWV